jgi:hypothetical protein
VGRGGGGGGDVSKKISACEYRLPVGCGLEAKGNIGRAGQKYQPWQHVPSRVLVCPVCVLWRMYTGGPGRWRRSGVALAATAAEESPESFWQRLFGGCSNKKKLMPIGELRDVGEGRMRSMSEEI